MKNKGPDLPAIVRGAHERAQRSKKEQRKYDDFAGGVTRARKALLEAADQLQDAMEAISKRRVPCKIVEVVGRATFRRFARLDEKVLEALEDAQALEGDLRPGRFLDEMGQAPCPTCREVLTNDGVVCSYCELASRHDAPG